MVSTLYNELLLQTFFFLILSVHMIKMYILGFNKTDDVCVVNFFSVQGIILELCLFIICPLDLCMCLL